MSRRERKCNGGGEGNSSRLIREEIGCSCPDLCISMFLKRIFQHFKQQDKNRNSGEWPTWLGTRSRVHSSSSQPTAFTQGRSEIGLWLAALHRNPAGVEFLMDHNESVLSDKRKEMLSAQWTKNSQSFSCLVLFFLFRAVTRKRAFKAIFWTPCDSSCFFQYHLHDAGKYWQEGCVLRCT